jgi:hypothetical protein
MTLRRPALRRAAVVAGPLLLYVTGLIHPSGVRVGEDDSLFLGVHLAFPFVICLTAWSLVLLVEGIDGAAATLARALAIPFAVAYTAFATFDGIAVGTFVAKANDLPAGAQPAAAELIHRVTHSELEWPLYVVAAVAWLAAALAVVVALRRHAPAPALALMAIGAVIFAKSHVRPWGPAGMAAFLAGVVWLELRAARAGEAAAGASVHASSTIPRTGR